MVNSKPQIYDLWSFSNLYRTLALLGVSFLPFAVSVQALAPPRPELPAQAADIERRQEQELEHQRARAEERPDVLSPQVSEGVGQSLNLPTETPCFALSALTWEGEQPPVDLLWASQMVIGQCVGAQGLRTLHTYLMNQLIKDGLITSRALIPGVWGAMEQPTDLSLVSRLPLYPAGAVHLAQRLPALRTSSARAC